MIELGKGLIKDIVDKRCALFIGTGLSSECGFPGSRKLAADLAQLIGYDNPHDPLTKITQYYCAEFGRSRLMEYLEAVFLMNPTPDPGRSHKLMVEIGYFDTIITTNWDCLIEDAYKGHKGLRHKSFKIDSDIPSWDAVDYKILKIHGCITNRNTIVITEDDYTNILQKIDKSPIFIKLKDLMQSKRLVFIGYGLGDPDLQLLYSDLLKKLGEFAYPPYAVQKDAPSVAIRRWKQRNIEIIPVSAEEFFVGLRDQLVGSGYLVIEGVQQLTQQELDNLVPSFEIVDDRIETRGRKVDNKAKAAFYKGNPPTWREIIAKLDCKRFVSLHNKKVPYEKFRGYVLQHSTEGKVSVILITGAAGTGKTTLLLRLGYDLYRYSQHMKFCVLCLSLETNFHANQLRRFYKYTRRPLFVLIDVHDVASTMDSLNKGTKLLAQEDIPITFILAARKNEWENAGGWSSLKVDRQTEVELGNLNETEIKDLLQILEENNQLGNLASLSPIERFNKFVEQARNQLLVALREATEGRFFDQIIMDEYKKLKKENPKAAEAYLYICFLFAYGVSTPTSLLHRLIGNPSDPLKDVVTPAKGIIFFERGWKQKFPAFRARHEIIASIIMKKAIGSLESRLKVISCIVAAVDEGSAQERYAVLKFLRGLISKYGNEQERLQNIELARKLVRGQREKFNAIINVAQDQRKDVELSEWGFVYGKLGFIEQNKICLQKALKITPHKPDINYHYANTQLKLHPKLTQEEAQKLEPYFKKAYEGGFLRPPGLIRYGKLKIILGQPEQAAQLFEEILKDDPEHQICKLVYFDLMKKYREAGQYDQVIRICKDGLKVNGRNIKTRWSLANALEQLGCYEEAFKEYDTITTLKFNHEAALEKCAYLSIRLGSDYLGRAESFLCCLIHLPRQKDLNTAKWQNDLALVLTKIGPARYEEAEALWKKAIIDWPPFSWSYIELGNFYFHKRNNPEKAIQYIEKGRLFAEAANQKPPLTKAQTLLTEIHSVIEQKNTR